MDTISIIIIILWTDFVICSLGANYFNTSSVTLMEPMGYHFASKYNDTLWIVAGHGDSTGDRTGFDATPLPLADSPWTTKHGALPNVTYLHNMGDCGVDIDDKIYLINPAMGNDNSYHYMIVYSVTSGTYSIGDTPTYKARGICAAYNPLNNVLYVVGGLGGDDSLNYLRYTQRLNISSGKWMDRGSDIINKRMWAGCSVATNTLYLFGGFDGDLSFLDVIEGYSVLSDTWSDITAKLTEKRYNLKCRTLSTLDIVCIGGYGANGASDTVDIFQPSTETIISTLQLKQARYYFTASVWNQGRCILVAGGYESDITSRLSSIEIYGDCSVTMSPTSAISTMATSNPSTVTPTYNPTTSTISATTSILTDSPTVYPSINPTIEPWTMSPTSVTPTNHSIVDEYLYTQMYTVIIKENITAKFSNISSEILVVLDHSVINLESIEIESGSIVILLTVSSDSEIKGDDIVKGLKEIYGDIDVGVVYYGDTTSTQYVTQHTNESSWKWWYYLMMVIAATLLIVTAVFCIVYKSQNEQFKENEKKIESDLDRATIVEVMGKKDDGSQLAITNETENDTINVTKQIGSTPMDKNAANRNNLNKLGIKQWLDGIQLSQYYDAFISNGYESMQFIREICSVTELSEIGIVHKEQQTTFMDEISKLSANPLAEGNNPCNPTASPLRQNGEFEVLGEDQMVSDEGDVKGYKHKVTPNAHYLQENDEFEVLGDNETTKGAF